MFNVHAEYSSSDIDYYTADILDACHKFRKELVDNPTRLHIVDTVTGELYAYRYVERDELSHLKVNWWTVDNLLEL